jgi:excisionase family DNA binding protein
MQRLSVADAAKRLGISPRRVQQLVKAGRLPAEEFGGAFIIKESDLGLVANRRPGRPSAQPEIIAESVGAPKKRTKVKKPRTSS